MPPATAPPPRRWCASVASSRRGDPLPGRPGGGSPAPTGGRGTAPPSIMTRTSSNIPGPGIVRVGNVEGAGAVLERHQQRDLVGVRLRARPAPQDALVTAVERDDEVVVGEVRVRELPSAVPCLRRSRDVERIDRALIGTFADVPVAGAGAGRGDAVARPAASANSAEHDLRHRRAADVARAHEHDAEGRSPALAVMASILPPASAVPAPDASCTGSPSRLLPAEAIGRDERPIRDAGWWHVDIRSRSPTRPAPRSRRWTSRSPPAAGDGGPTRLPTLRPWLRALPATTDWQIAAARAFFALAERLAGDVVRALALVEAVERDRRRPRRASRSRRLHEDCR